MEDRAPRSIRQAETSRLNFTQSAPIVATVIGTGTEDETAYDIPLWITAIPLCRLDLVRTALDAKPEPEL
jgi:hypothetical protein